MRHQAEDIAVVVDDSRDVALGAVGIGRRRNVSSCVDVAENDATFALETIESFLRRDESSVAVSHRNAQYLAALVEIGEHRFGILDANPNRIRHELQMRVTE